MKLDVRGKNGLEITPAIRMYIEKKLKRIERMFS